MGPCWGALRSLCLRLLRGLRSGGDAGKLASGSTGGSRDAQDTLEALLSLAQESRDGVAKVNEEASSTASVILDLLRRPNTVDFQKLLQAAKDAQTDPAASSANVVSANHGQLTAAKASQPCPSQQGQPAPANPAQCESPESCGQPAKPKPAKS